MLAIDTNLILYYLIGDNPRQAARARRLVDDIDIFVRTTVQPDRVGACGASMRIPFSVFDRHARWFRN
jgi:predicted nucleic acid-binding protein